MKDTPTLQASLAYRARGLAVFPLNGKIPTTEHGVKDAMLDATFDPWFGSFGGNIGIAVPEGVVVIDIDPRNGGGATWNGWADAYDILPFSESPCAETGGGGWHYWFRYDGRSLVKSIGGVDFKRIGGYVVAPPSKTDDEYTWLQRLPKNLADLPEMPDWLLELATKDKPEPEARVWAADLIPGDDDDLPPAPRRDEDLDRFLESISLVDAYNKWAPKPPIVPGRKNEMLVRCPTTEHADEKPSCSLNQSQGVWTCHSCGAGGDKFTLAANHFGLDLKVDFPDLKREMALDLGYVVHSTGGTDTVSKAREEEVPPAPILQIAAPPPPPEIIAIDWRSILPEGTFLREWMDLTTQDDLPEEYYFWLGLMAVGLACGRKVYLSDYEDVRGNLAVCLFGPSGIGKTRSRSALTKLLRRALPYDPHEEDLGTRVLPEPGSAESLIDMFSERVLDAVNKPIEPPKYHIVRGLVTFGELSSLISKSNRHGSALKPTLHDLFDGYDAVEITSRTHGEVHAEPPFCSAITTTQPRAVRELLVQSDADSGFINRWIFAVGPYKKLISYGSKPLDINPLVPKLQRISRWAQDEREFTLTGDALAVWEQFFDRVIDPVRTSDETSLLTRCDLHLKKLIVLLTANEMLAQPTAEIVERAISLYPYLETSYTLLGTDLGNGVWNDTWTMLAETIVDLQQKLRRAPSLRDLNRRVSKRYQRNVMSDVLDWMVKYGEVAVDLVPTPRGPQTKRYSYVG